MHLGVSCAESEMEPRAVARYRISRERRPTGLSEPIRQVVAAWLVTVFVLVAGLSVLVFHERGGRDDGVAAVALRWHSPPVAGAGSRTSVYAAAAFVRARANYQTSASATTG